MTDYIYQKNQCQANLDTRLTTYLIHINLFLIILNLFLSNWYNLISILIYFRAFLLNI